jgi:hypothetical protein
MPSKTLTASYILDASTLSPGLAQADAELGGLDASAAELSSKVDGHTAAMGEAFGAMGAGIGADVGAGVEDAKGKLGDLDNAGSDLSKGFDSSTSKIGSMFKGLGESLGNFGLPFIGALSKMGDKLDEAKSKGQGFNQVVSDVGGITLAAGAVGLAAFGTEAVKMADEFDVAQSQLQVAIKNSGGSFDKEKSSIDAVYSSMAKLGFNSTQVAGSLASLVTSSGSTQRAIEMESTAADLARAKHISLESATSILTKTLAGSTRGLTTLGINLDVGSGKLKTVASDTTAYQKAQDNLHLVNQQVSDGVLKGADAYSKLLAAHQAVDTTSQKLALDQGTVSKILDTVKQKTQGAADAYGQTLAGEMSTAGAETHNLATNFGEELIPKLTEALGVVEESVGWLEKHKAVAEALGIAVGTVLAGAVAVFTVNMVSGMIASTKSALTSIGLLSAETDTETASTEALTAAISSLEAALIPAAAAEQQAATDADLVTAAWESAGELAGTLDAGLATLAASFEEVGANAVTTAGELATYDAAVETAGATSVTAAGEIDTLGASASGVGSKMSLAGDAAGAEGLAGGLGEGEIAAGGLAAALGPVALGLGAAELAGYGLSKVLGSDLNPAVGTTFDKLDAMKSANTIPGLQSQLAELRGEMQKDAAQPNNYMASTVEYGILASKVDTVNGKLQNLSARAASLGSQFGVTQGQTEFLAQSLGIDLGKSLTTKQLEEFQNAVSEMGGTSGIAAEQAKIAFMEVGTAATNMKLTAASAATDTHNGVVGALTPLVGDLTTVGDKSTAGLVQAFTTSVSKAGQASQNIYSQTINPLEPLVQKFLSVGNDSAANFVQALVNKEGATVNASQRLHDASTKSLDTLAWDLAAKGNAGAAGLVSALASHTGDMSNSGAAWAAAISTAFSSSQNWASLGTSIDEGIAGGIAGGTGLMQAAMAGVAGKTLLAGKNAVGAHSPSTLARDLIGLPITQGIAEGILSGAGLVAGAMTEAVKGVASTPVTLPTVSGPAAVGDIVSGSGGGAGAGGAGTTVVNNFTLNVAGNVATERDMQESFWQFLLNKSQINGSAGQLVGAT